MTGRELGDDDDVVADVLFPVGDMDWKMFAIALTLLPMRLSFREPPPPDIIIIMSLWGCVTLLFGVLLLSEDGGGGG